MSELLRDRAIDLPIVMTGHLGAKDGPEYDDVAHEWRQSFISGVEGSLKKCDCYNRVIFLRNVNLKPYTELRDGTQKVTGKLPIFHAAVVFLWDNEPRWVYLFNTDADLDLMAKRFPYEDLLLEDGRRFGDVATERGIKYELIYANEEPEKPVTWDDAEQYQDYGFIAMPCWVNQDMRDWYCESMERLVTQNLGQLVPVPHHPARDGQKPLLDLPQVYYEFKVPGAEFVVGYVASWTDDGPDEKAIYLVQHDVVPKEDVSTMTEP